MGASSIEIELEVGGNQKILISDNGSGIPAKEFELAIKRHATSKIAQASDLFDIHTMGFRGEALASISEVCKFTIQSRTADEEVGCRLVKNDEVGLKSFPFLEKPVQQSVSKICSITFLQGRSFYARRRQNMPIVVN